MLGRTVGSVATGAVFALAIAIALARPAPAQEMVKLGYVDLERAVAETEEGRRARAAIKKDFDQKQKELSEREEELKKKIEDFQKKRTLLAADVARQKEEEIQKNMAEAQQILVRHQQSIQQKEQEALQPIMERLHRIIFKISQAENFTMVFEKRQAGVIFAKAHLDLTNELIRRFNSGEEAGARGKPAAPAAKPPGGATKAPPAPKK